VTRARIIAVLVGVAGAAVLALGATAATSLTDPNHELRPRYVANHQLQVPGNQSAAHLSADHVPRPVANGLATSNADLGLDLAGLNFEEQRTADGGNQFSLEPPDQALCVGNGFAFESVNNVFRIRSSVTGAPIPPGTIMALNPFFTEDHAINRATGDVGEDLADPKCYFDPDLGRFFFTVLHIGQTDEGVFDGKAYVNVAVSKSSTPTTNRGDWWQYQLDVTNDGSNGTTHPDCPCFGDQPLIGADRYGFYVTTNEFDLEPFGGSFNGAQIYAFDKAALASGTMKVQRIEGAPLASSYTAEGTPYSLQPASSPSTADWASASNGTEYLLGALEFSKGNVTLDNRVAVWALTNTQSLTTATPSVQVDDVVVTTQPYGFPPDAAQKDGPTPLADDAFFAATGTDKPGNGPKEHENLVAGNDDRMQDAVLVNGTLWGALNTIVKTQNGSSQVGAAYFALTPSVGNGNVSAVVAKQGYVTINGASVLYPAIAMNNDGKGAIVFTVSGKAYFPSAAYSRLTLVSGAGPVHIARLGVKPADGFTGYSAFGGSGTERWGDYSDAVVNPEDGTLWLATEWIQGNVGWQPRVANWNTRILKINP
jgi:hypothetical protein